MRAQSGSAAIVTNDHKFIRLNCTNLNPAIWEDYAQTLQRRNVRPQEIRDRLTTDVDASAENP